MSLMATPYKHPKTSVYYLRIGVPENIRHIIGKTVIKKSLNTKNLAEAKSLFTRLHTQTLDSFERARRQLTGGDSLTSRDIAVLVDTWLQMRIDELEEKGSYSALLVSFLDTCPRTNDTREDTENWFSLVVEPALERSNERLGAIFKSDIAHLLTKHNVALDEASPLYKTLLNQIAHKAALLCAALSSFIWPLGILNLGKFKAWEATKAFHYAAN